MANQTQLTITEALVKLKRYKKNASASLDELSRKQSLVWTTETKSKDRTADQYREDSLKALHDSFESNLNNYMTVKSAIAVSNATTEIEVDGTKLTVQQTIETKNVINELSILNRLTKLKQSADAAMIDAKDRADSLNREQIESLKEEDLKKASSYREVILEKAKKKTN